MLAQTVSHPAFQLLSQTAHVRFHSRKRIHTRLSEKDGTQRPTHRNRGASPPSATAQSCATSEITLYAAFVTLDSATLLYTYISRFSVNPHHQAEGENQAKLPLQLCPNRFSSRFSTSRTNGPRLLSWAKVGTHSALLKGSHTAAHTPKQRPSGRGRYHYPRTVSHVAETLRGQGVERQTLPLLGLGRRRSRRTQKAFGTAMCLCASLSRGVAAPLGCVIFFAFVEITVCTSCTHGFPRVRKRGWYHYPRSVPRAAETLDVRLPKGLICRFLRSGCHHWFQRRKMCPAFYKNSSSSRQTAPVPCERDRSCFFVTSWSVPGTRRSARGCRYRWGRNDRCPRRW